MTDGVTVRCHAELNDFLPRKRQHTTFAVRYVPQETIKNLVESLGIPHPEVAALWADSVSVDFGYQVQRGDQIEVAPISVVTTRPALPLRPPPTLHFVLDTHLGRLAAYLRMLGFDSLYRNDSDDPELAELTHTTGRILLTRDIGLLKRSMVLHGYFVRTTKPEQQLCEVIQRFNLRPSLALFRRCIRCNGLIYPIAKAEIDHLLAPKTRLYYHEFYQCQACTRIYWQGSHHAHMQRIIERVLQASASTTPPRRVA